jgi:hypothetical protein
MPSTPGKVATLTSAALTLGMHFAHVLELRPKLEWSRELYLPVQLSLYRWYGVIGPVLELVTLILVATLAWRWRAQAARLRPLLVSLTMLIAGLLLWAIFVAAANRGLAGLGDGTTPADDWLILRAQWQYAQAAIFCLHLVGFGALATAIARPTADEARVR